MTAHLLAIAAVAIAALALVVTLNQRATEPPPDPTHPWWVHVPPAVVP
jgi:hypothetical protein